jgi:curved DNA-binding protein CbpA
MKNRVINNIRSISLCSKLMVNIQTRLFTFTKNIHNSNNEKSFYKQSKKNYNKDIDFSKDYYKVLGVTKESTDKEIKTAYHKLARQHHPDANGGKTSEKFKEVAAAYEVLSDKEKRSTYDSYTASGASKSSSQGRGFGGYNDFNPQSTDHNYSSNFYKSSSTQKNQGNYYSNFDNFDKFSKKFKDSGFYKEFYETYTFKDKNTGEYKTYTFKSNKTGNPFYNDFEGAFKRKRKNDTNPQQNNEGTNNSTNYSNDFFGNNYQKGNPFSNTDHFKNFKNPNNQNKMNDQFSYEQYELRREYWRLFRWVLLSTLFIIWYSSVIRKRREYYLQQQYIGAGLPTGQTYYEPIRYTETPKYHSHYNDERTYLRNSEVPPYK